MSQVFYVCSFFLQIFSQSPRKINILFINIFLARDIFLNIVDDILRRDPKRFPSPSIKIIE